MFWNSPETEEAYCTLKNFVVHSEQLAGFTRFTTPEQKLAFFDHVDAALEVVNSESGVGLTPEYLHRILMRSAREPGGDYREDDDVMAGYPIVSHWRIPHLMEKWNEAAEIIVGLPDTDRLAHDKRIALAENMHLMLMRITPFKKGSARIARLEENRIRQSLHIYWKAPCAPGEGERRRYCERVAQFQLHDIEEHLDSIIDARHRPHT